MSRLPLYAWRDGDGRVLTTWLVTEGDTLAVAEDAGDARGLPPGAIPAVFRRYGKPLAVTHLEVHAVLPLPGEAGRVAAFRFRGWGDVEDKDYVLYEPADGEAVAAPAPLVSAALAALARAASPA